MRNQIVCKKFNFAQNEIAIRQLKIARFRSIFVVDLLKFKIEIYSYSTTMCEKNRRVLTWILI